MRTIAFSLISLLLVPAFAQDGAPKRLVPAAGLHHSSDKSPVTCDEAISVFKDMRHVLGAGIGQAVPGDVSIKPGSKAVTREQIVKEFSYDYNALRPQMKFTPNPAVVEPDRLKIASAEKPELIKLIRMGFVGRVGPLATGPTDTITIGALGDAVGFFISRMAQVTHMPSPKWTPMLGAGG